MKILPKIETGNGHASTDEFLVYVSYQRAKGGFWRCSYPREWWENDESCLYTKEFVEILITELENSDRHVSLTFYKAMKKYLYDKDFSCLIEEV